jgi:ketosteroid isomerase-like protein
MQASNVPDLVRRCYAVFEIEKLFDRGDEAFVRYRIERDTGESFRNTEYLKVKDGRIERVEVYYGI